MSFKDLPTYKLPWAEHVTYWKLSEVRELYSITLLEDDRFYLLSEKVEQYGLEFACFESCGCEDADDDWLTLVAKGSICYVDGKKEIRHIYWGDEEGYIFYFDIDNGLKMLNALKKHLEIHGHDF